MTGTVAILLAICAGLVVGNKRQMIWALALPYLAVLGVQTWGIWSGRGVNPPSTVKAFPGSIGYYVVQIVIFALAVAIANQLRLRRIARSGAAADGRRQFATAGGINIAISALLVGLWQLDHNFFQQGNVHTHTGNGSPPLLGVLGMGSLVVSFIVLTAMAGWRRFFSRRAVPAGV